MTSFQKLLFPPLPVSVKKTLGEIPSLIDKVFPMPGRFRHALPANIAELSRLLTSGRGERGLSYLNHPPFLSAYLRYFFPWNLYRLCRLLVSLDLHLKANDCITDLGSGSLTLVSALWISRPELRTLPLEFRCIDLSGPALEAGKKFFAALCAGNNNWTVHTIKGEIGRVKAKPASLVCAVNVLNEMFGDLSRSGSHNMTYNAAKTVRLLKEYGLASSSVLAIEPGVPHCGEFLSALRSRLMENSFTILSPCPHGNACPFPGGKSASGKNRWCHFAFPTDDAPQPLHKLSKDAKLPKERAVLSFLYAESSSAKKQKDLPKDLKKELPARIISDAVNLPENRHGRYGCSAQGLVLLTGEKNQIKNIPSGFFINTQSKGERDPKSNALIVYSLK